MIAALTFWPVLSSTNCSEAWALATGQGWTLKLDKVYDHVSSINGCNVVLLGDTWGYAWYLVVQENVILYSYLYIIHFFHLIYNSHSKDKIMSLYLPCV